MTFGQCTSIVSFIIETGISFETLALHIGIFLIPVATLSSITNSKKEFSFPNNDIYIIITIIMIYILIYSNNDNDIYYSSCNNRTNISNLCNNPNFSNNSSNISNNINKNKSNNNNVNNNNKHDSVSYEFRNKISQSNTNLRNPKYKPNLNNNNNDNSGDNSKNNNNENNNNDNNKYVFILVGGNVKDLNGFLFSKAINHECIVKVRPFSLAKVQCMYDHVKPTIKNVNPDK